MRCLECLAKLGFCSPRCTRINLLSIAKKAAQPRTDVLKSAASLVCIWCRSTQSLNNALLYACASMMWLWIQHASQSTRHIEPLNSYMCHMCAWSVVATVFQRSIPTHETLKHPAVYDSNIQQYMPQTSSSICLKHPAVYASNIQQYMHY